MTRAYIKLTRAALIAPGDGVFMLDTSPDGRPGTVLNPRWRCFTVVNVDTFGANKILLGLKIRRRPDRPESYLSAIADKTEYLPRLLAWIREDEND